MLKSSPYSPIAVYNDNENLITPNQDAAHIRTNNLLSRLVSLSPGGGGGGGGGGGDSHMNWTAMLVVSLRGVNFGFWSRLGCSGQNVIIFSRQGLV